MDNAGHKKRITITISDEELAIARASGETVSGYIGRLIREAGDRDTLHLPLPDGLGRLLESSGVLDDASRARLFDHLVQVVVRHVDETLLNSRAKLMAITDEAIMAASKSRQDGQ